MESNELAALFENKPDRCEACGGKLYYHGIGEYICNDCSHLMYDDYGKVRKYIETSGTTSIDEIARETGVPREILSAFLKDGAFQIPKASRYMLKCNSCGCSIRSGRYCEECMAETSRGLKDAFSGNVSPSKPQKEEKRNAPKMHFLGRNRDH